MNWDLPYYVKIDGEKFEIRNKCDFRVILDCISILNDETIFYENRIRAALLIFYKDFDKIKNLNAAITEMLNIISCGENEEETETESPKLMDWEKDFTEIAAGVSKQLGYDIRTPGIYVHWWTFISAFKEMGNCLFMSIVSIREKLCSGESLTDWEKDFYKKNKSKIESIYAEQNREIEEWLCSVD